jgi:hypothetical protein
MKSFKVAFLALLSFQLGFLTHGQPSLNDNPIQNVQSGYQDLIKDQTEDQGIEYERRSDKKSILEINNFQMGSFPQPSLTLDEVKAELKVKAEPRGLKLEKDFDPTSIKTLEEKSTNEKELSKNTTGKLCHVYFYFENVIA